MLSASATRRPRLHYGIVIVGVGFLATAAGVGFGRHGYTMILPPMRQALSLSDTQAGMLASATQLGYLLFSLVAGALAARFGPRLVASVSMAWVGSAMALTGLVPSFELAAMLRFVTGLGTAGCNISIMGLASAWAATSRRGLVTGIIVGGSAPGILATGLLIPAVVQAQGAEGWRISWYILGGIALAVAVLLYAFLRNSPAEKGVAPLGGEQPKADVAGSARGLEDSRPRTGNAALTPGGSRLGVFSWGQVFRSRELWQLGPIYGLWGFTHANYTTFFARYLTAEAGYGAADAGALWSIVGVLSLLSGVLFGFGADRIGRRFALAGAFALQAVAYLAFAAAPGRPDLVPYSAILAGLAAWGTPGIMATLAGDYCGARMAPAGLGFLTVFFGLGQTLGPSAGGYLADTVASFAPGFAIGALLLFINALATLRLPAHPHSLGASSPETRR